MSLWLFNIYMDSVIREMKAKVCDVGVKMCGNGSKWVLNTIMFGDNTDLNAASENDLQKLVNVFESVCKKRKLTENIDKSKVMVFERNKREKVNFDCLYRLRVECPKKCEIRLNGEKMDEVSEFKYIGSILCKYGSMEGEMKEKAVQGRTVVGCLGRMM